MIPVAPKPEPAGFDASVRQPGLTWLRVNGLAGMVSPPPKKTIKAYWTNCLPELMSAYDSVCAYASLRIAPVTGAQSVEHFAPKSRALSDAYEWDNYRLACARMNARKNNFTDVLDPFAMPLGVFELVVGNGELRPAAGVGGQLLLDARATIARLKLDDPDIRAARLSIIDHYLAGDFSTAFLARESPFIHGELDRLGLLRP